MALTKTALTGVITTLAVTLCLALPAHAQQGQRGDRYPAQDFGSIPRIDQRNPLYQRAFEHLSRAQQLLANAAREVQAARTSYALPGFRYDLFLDDLQYLNGQLSPVLMPERRRLEYQTLTPSADYFVPGAPRATDAPTN
ncbi:hypothetical protein J7355_16770 [Endozoicomonas sp. G2_2]|uniref:hypothetical protein n=1 Tax=Endozoicomonas sp. G2_2 TaxID=2821092 RepID=UPI001ADA6552|nr:hypothetical protein [Endozoicomonas sp. G2_2]MBO9471746.1 hypothetical protein [Endozoicomonas sp. G2_2]